MMTHGKENGRTIGRILMALAVAGLFTVAAGPASAHDEWRHEGNGRHFGHYDHRWHGRRPVYYEPGYIVAPPPVVMYAPPPPVVYLRRPMPVYQQPSVNFVFPLR